MSNRSSFTGKIGFVLAAAGSAVGLGNIWRFPYLAAQYGGGIFLLIYIILSITFGFSLMIAEIAIGRKTGLSPIGAFKKLNKRFSFVGYLAALVPMIILPYYSVIGGWVMKYLFGFATGEGTAMANPIMTPSGETSYFVNYISGLWEPIGWFLLFMAITAVVVALGVEKGIEKVSKVMMPILIGLILFISIYSICTLPGALDGVLFYITPDFSKFSFMTVVAAMGQLFYSMSLAMGIMITFGSYMKKDISIESSAHQIEWFDTGVAFLAGLMIIPSVFVFENGDMDKMNKGSGLMFDTLPKVFEDMPFGDIIGFAFFLMVLFAALTSSISLMETVVSVMQDKFKWSRKLSCVLILAISLALGIPSALGYSIWSGVEIAGLQILDFFDFISNSIIMPLVAFATCIFVGYFIKPKAVAEEIELSSRFKNKAMFNVMIKYISPVFTLLILVSSVLDVLGIIRI